MVEDGRIDIAANINSGVAGQSQPRNLSTIKWLDQPSYRKRSHFEATEAITPLFLSD